MTEHWLAPAAVVPQEAAWLGEVDDQPWTAGRGFYRGFSSSFEIGEKDVWFHWPFQLAAGSRVTGFQLLWETEGDTRIGWGVCHHGGAERVPLTERLAPVVGEPVPFDPPELWRQYYPPMQRMLTGFDLPVPLETRFGMQLCIMATGVGTMRFYGAAVVTG